MVIADAVQAASCDLVMVTPSGLELYEVGERATSLRYGGKLSQPVKWWRYAHDTRLVILGTGELGLWLQVGHQPASEKV